MDNKRTGQSGEQLACRFLRELGMEILDTNVRMKLGEIDILAKDRDCIVIVEVKTKNSFRFGRAEEMVDKKKKTKLLTLAKELSIKYCDHDIRIDVVAVNDFFLKCEIEYYKNAVCG